MNEHDDQTTPSSPEASPPGDEAPNPTATPDVGAGAADSTDDPEVSPEPNPSDDAGEWWGTGSPTPAPAADAATDTAPGSTAVLDDAVHGQATGDPVPPPPPPGPAASGPPGSAPSAPVPGLVRDPNATFGGVLSGLAHRYAMSVAAVRLAFVALLLVSGGTALLLYLAAWVIVPRATHWPPAVVRNRGERLSNRDLGIALAVVGLLAFLVVGSNGAGAVLVPVVLVGAGIWLLVQPGREEEAASAATPPSVPSFATPPPVGQPVPPRRRRRWIVRILVAGVVLVSLAVAAIAIAVARGGFDGFDVRFGNDRLVVANYVPDTIDDLPDDIDARVGGVRLDLTDLDPSDFAGLDAPIELDIEIRDGGVDLTLPEDLAVSIDASVRDGDIDVDGARLPGADITSGSVDLDLDDPDMIITIEVDEGGIDIDTER